MFNSKKDFRYFCDKLTSAIIYIISFSIIIFILWLLYSIVNKGIGQLNYQFLVGLPDELNAGGGIGPFLFNSLYVTFISMVISLPISLGAGIFMAEYARENKFTSFIRIAIESLASVPSIVLGLFGLALFVGFFHMGLTIIGGAATLALLNIPVLCKIIEDSIKDVPAEYQSSALALGATKFQTLTKIVLPVAMARIFTGISLVTGRAFGESAVIILVAGTSAADSMWNFNIFAPGATLAVHLWYVQAEAIVPDAADIAAKSAALLVCVVLAINLLLRVPALIIKLKNK